MAEEYAVLWDDPGWLIALKAVGVFVFLVLMTLLTIWGERRVVARMQMRVGPNRVGPFGLLQGLADGIKLAFKEDLLPTAAHKAVFILAPIISTICAFLAFAVIPMGGQVSIFGEQTLLQLTDFSIAVLYVVAVASVGIYGIVLAGWASGSTYPLLGGLRSSAQMIAYEIAMGLSFVAVFLYAGTMSTGGIVDAQTNLWYAIILAPSFIIYVISMVGETNRAPFDLPEAEGELVGGFHTEYSSLKFALFFLAEYINMITVSALATTLFLGGWRAPWPITAFWEGANSGWWPLLWFLVKLAGFLFFFIWLRGTLPRLRYDQFMGFGWKVLIPISLGWIVVVSAVRALDVEGVDARTWLIAAAIAALALLALSFALDARDSGREAAALAAEAAEEDDEVLPGEAGYAGHPVPPADSALAGPAGRSATGSDPAAAEELETSHG